MALLRIEPHIVDTIGNFVFQNATVTSNISSGNASLGNLATASYFSGNGSLLTSLNGSTVTGQVANSLVSSTVYTNAQPNITSVGTLSSLVVTGNVSSSGNIIGNGQYLTSLSGSNVIGTVANANYAAYSGTAYSISGGNVSGQVGNSLISGTVYTAAQPNITSVGTLTGLGITGNLNVTGNINVTGNLNYSNVTNLEVGDPLIYIGSNNSGNLYDLGIVASFNDGNYQHTGLARDHTDGTWKLFTHVSAEPTTVIDWANATYASFKSGNVTALSNVIAGNLLTDNLLYANGSPYVFSGGAVVSSTAPSSPTSGMLWLDSDTGDISVYFGGAWAALTTQSATAQTVTSNAQPNITSVGTLSSLNVSGNVTASYLIGNGSQLTGLPASYANSNVAAYLTANPQPGTYANANVAAYLPTYTGTLSAESITTTGAGGNISGANYITANYFVGNGSNVTNVDAATLSGHSASYFATSTQGTKADTALQSGANISLLTNDTGFITTANLSTYATQSFVNSAVANLVNAAPAALDTLSELATALGNDASYSTTITNALANKLSTSSFTSTADTWLATKSTSNVVEGTNLYYTVSRANTAIDNRVTKTFIDGLGVIASVANSVTGANVTGQVANSLIAGTVYTNAQPNITSVGTLSSLNVSGNVTATYILGNGSALSSITGANVIGTVASATTAGTVTIAAQPNITSVGTLASLSITGLTTATGGIKTANIQDATGTVTLQTKYNNQSGDIGVVGNIIAGTGGTGNVSATYFIGNGSQLTGLPATYANSNVALYLPTYTGAFAPGSITISNANLHISGGTANAVLSTDGTGNLTWANVASSTSQITVDSFIGDGTTTAFTLSVSPNSVSMITVNYNGTVLMRSSYSILGSTLTLGSAPAAGSNIEVISITSLASPGSSGTSSARAVGYSLVFGG